MDEKEIIGEVEGVFIPDSIMAKAMEQLWEWVYDDLEKVLLNFFWIVTEDIDAKLKLQVEIEYLTDFYQKIKETLQEKQKTYDSDDFLSKNLKCKMQKYSDTWEKLCKELDKLDVKDNSDLAKKKVNELEHSYYSLYKILEYGGMVIEESSKKTKEETKRQG